MKKNKMKKNLELRAGAALLAALLLALTGCVDVGMIESEDGPTGIYVGSNTFTFGDEEEPPEPEEMAEPDGGSLPEDSVATGDGDAPYEDGSGLDEDGTYNSAEDVALYLHTFGKLPVNYITKEEAREEGWTGGSVEQVEGIGPGFAIGGDRFGNRENKLPEGTYYECDVDTAGQSGRGAKRLVYSDDGRIYYTEDHYSTFTLLYGEE